MPKINLPSSSVLMMTFQPTTEVIVCACILFGAACISLIMKGRKKIALNPEKAQPFALIDVVELSHDTRRFRFALQSKDHVLGLPIGKHISLRYNDDNGKLVSRSYTPVTSDDEVGYVDFVIKVYFAGVHPKFPDGGKMSQHLNNLKIGDTIDMMGPKGAISYNGRGNFSFTAKRVTREVKAKKVGLIAGGTGIAPMLQLIRAARKDPQDNTEFWLLLANQTEDDILLREELEEAAKDDRFHLWYTVDRASEGWTYSTGFVCEEMLAEHMPAPGDDTLILMCGPPPMIKFACLPNLEKLGYDDSRIQAY